MTSQLVGNFYFTSKRDIDQACDPTTNTSQKQYKNRLSPWLPTRLCRSHHLSSCCYFLPIFLHPTPPHPTPDLYICAVCNSLPYSCSSISLTPLNKRELFGEFLIYMSMKQTPMSPNKHTSNVSTPPIYFLAPLMLIPL